MEISRKHLEISKKLLYVEGSFIAKLSDNQTFKLSAEELWQIIEEAQHYFLDLESPLKNTLRPVRKFVINGREINFIFSHNLNFWKKVEKGRWEPRTFKILDHFVNESCTYIDVGAWIGPTLIYAAQRAKEAYAFEPNPIAFHELELNVQANSDIPGMDRVKIYRKAVGTNNGRVVIGSRRGGGDSKSSVLFPQADMKWEVETISLGDLISSLNNKSRFFIKMDIEGGEYELIPMLKEVFSKYNIDLFLSLHPRGLARSLKTRNKTGIGNNTIRLLKVLRKHMKLVWSLPFRYLYTDSGKAIGRLILSLNPIMTEIVATNRKWERTE